MCLYGTNLNYIRNILPRCCWQAMGGMSNCLYVWYPYDPNIFTPHTSVPPYICMHSVCLYTPIHPTCAFMAPINLYSPIYLYSPIHLYSLIHMYILCIFVCPIHAPYVCMAPYICTPPIHPPMSVCPIIWYTPHTSIHPLYICMLPYI